jgi:hypothetical protein
VVLWIHLALDRDHWWALVNAVMNLRVLVPWSYLTKFSRLLSFCKSGNTLESINRSY